MPVDLRMIRDDDPAGVGLKQRRVNMFRTVAATLAAAAIVTAAGWASAAEMAGAELKNQAGESVGSVTLTQTPHGTLMHAKLMNLPAGAHAFHVHAVGKCEAPFKSAGGHYNPSGAKHGIMNADGKHAGDMPNVHVPDSGALEIEVLAAAVSLNDDLFDADGAAIVMHEGPDDYMSDPAGAAGPRIACGVIVK
jgi:Cu-Zn family superoxide dismutase